jgi:endonuclease YncB( thermonuclease family)
MPPIGTILFGIALIIDGDTLVVDGDRLRLQGIDAPELRQECQRDEGAYDCGAAAADYLREMLAGRGVICMVRAADGEDAVASCESEGRDLAAAMLEAGWAFATPKSGRRNAAIELEARTAKAGMWAGSAEAPWLWRLRPH